MLTKAQIKRRLKIVVGVFKRIGLNNTDFSILSNNCWGGAVYDHFHLPYLTPTIGLWIGSEDYIRFLANISFYFSQQMEQLNWKECHYKEILLERKRRGKYTFDLDDLVIGRIYDIDVVFFHYRTFEDAKRKWDKRKTRVNFENLLVKFNDQNGFRDCYYDEFMQLPYKNKLFITAHKEYAGKPNVVFINEAEWDGSIKDDTALSKMPFDLKKYLNQIGDEMS